MANELMVYRGELAESGFVTAEVYLSPLPGTEPIRVKARIGSPVRDILPETARAPMVCIIDGVPIKREWWLERPVCEGDRIQFYPVYLGGNDNSRSILAVVAMIVLYIYAPYIAGAISNATGWAYGAVYNGVILVGTALISAILPSPTSTGNQNGEAEKPSSVYSTDTSGNQARVFNPIPVQYGRLKYYPNYAAQPYSWYYKAKPTNFDPNDINVPIPINLKATDDEEGGYDRHADGEQYYFALFCLGQGHYDIHSVEIADTPLATFKDVLVARILKPGEYPKYVRANIITNEAVGGIDLDDGKFAGPFYSCAPGRKVSWVGFDFVLPQGLAIIDDRGGMNHHSIYWSVYAQPVNDLGSPIGDWVLLGTPGLVNGSTSTPQRYSVGWDLTPGRYRFKVARQGVSDKHNSRVLDSSQWAALRCTLYEYPSLCKTATHFELVMRASNQLSSLSQRKISVTATRRLSSWDSNELTPTRSPARALWDKWTNPVYGDGLPRDRIDIDMLRKYDAVASERLDRFDYVFENRVSSQEADQVIAKTMRCVALQRQGVKTIVRDELVNMPLTLFNPTNTAEKSISMDYIQVTEETSDGVIAEYFSGKTWDWEEVECPGPGRTYSNTSHPMYNPALPVMTNPTRVTFNGITNRHHAEREGLYYAYSNALRRQFITLTTELQGALLYYGAPVLLATTLYNAQQGGEVRDWEPDTLTMSLTNGLVDGKLVLMRDDGSLTEPLEFDIVNRDKNTIRLKQPPDFRINYGSAVAERTKYVIVSGELIRRIVKILAITPKGLGDTGAPLYEIRGVVDVPEVHTVDEFALVPDDPDDPGGYFPDPDLPVQPSVISLGTFRAYARGFTSCSIIFTSTGAIGYSTSGNIPNEIPGAWVRGTDHWANPRAENLGSLYEICFDTDANNPDRGTWQSLEEDVTWTLNGAMGESLGYGSDSEISGLTPILIRDVATHTIQASGFIEWTRAGFQLPY